MTERNAHGTLCINDVFQFLLLIFRNVCMHIGITHLYYVVKWYLIVRFSPRRFNWFPFWSVTTVSILLIYLKSLEDTQGFLGSQRFYIQVTHLERNCKLCFAFCHSHKTHRSCLHSRELNLLIRCWQHYPTHECPLRKSDFEFLERLKLNFALWNQPESHLQFPRHFSKSDKNPTFC